MKFREHKYEWTKPYTATRQVWSFRGPDGGLHFHVTTMENEGYDPSCGLEFHYNFDPDGEGSSAAHHAHCWLTKQPCWHDGTSLYASETIWPMIKHSSEQGDHKSIFSQLEHEYDNHFTRTKENMS